MCGPRQAVRPCVLSTQWVHLMSRKEAGVLSGGVGRTHQERKGWVKFNGSETAAEESIFLSASRLQFCFHRESNKLGRINEHHSTTTPAPTPPREISQPFVFEIIRASRWSFVFLSACFYFGGLRVAEKHNLSAPKSFGPRPPDSLKRSDIND